MPNSPARAAIAALALWICAPVCQAAMVLSNVIVHFEAGQSSRQDVEIENTSNEPMYVQVTPHQVLAPGTEDEERVAITDPREAGLLVTPNKLVVPPNGRKRLRLVNLKPGGDEERVYRIAVAPVVGDLDAEQSGLKILIGYEMLVLVQPSEPEPNLVAQRSGKHIRFENQGNTNVLLREGRQCETADTAPEDCAILASKRLYPGNTWEMPLPYDREVEFYLASGTRNSVEVYR